MSLQTITPAASITQETVDAFCVYCEGNPHPLNYYDQAIEFLLIRDCRLPTAEEVVTLVYWLLNQHRFYDASTVPSSITTYVLLTLEHRIKEHAQPR